MAGPYAKKFSRTRYGCKEYFEIHKHFMGDDVINIEKDKAYSSMEEAKYHGE